MSQKQTIDLDILSIYRVILISKSNIIFLKKSNFVEMLRTMQLCLYIITINSHIRLTSCYKVKCNYQVTGGFVMERKAKIKFTDFECNLLINGMNEFRNMLLAENLSTRMLMICY